MQSKHKIIVAPTYFSKQTKVIKRVIKTYANGTQRVRIACDDWPVKWDEKAGSYKAVVGTDVFSALS